MNKRRVIISIGAAALALILAWCVMRFGFGFDPLTKHGWHADQYLDGLGKPLTGWQNIDGGRYYFDPVTGNKTRGFLQIGQKLYCFDENGKVRIGWYRDGEDTYLLSQDGSACTGLVNTERGNRFFDSNGKMAQGIRHTDNGTWYFGEDGNPAAGWLVTGEGTYYFDEQGKALIGWQELDEGTCYFLEDGKAADGWAELNGKHYYFENGMLYSGWLTQGADRYYLRQDGTMAVGEETIDGVSCFFTSSGKYVVLVNLWHPVPEDYVMEPVDVEGFQFDISGADSLKRMLEDCREAGFECYINNTYRSVYTQQRLEQRMLRDYQERGMSYYEAVYVMQHRLMKPGHSEHHLGLAVDMHGSDATLEWLAEHCWEYGFILRYPEDKTDKTGIIYEPWHFRYVGTELSLELQESGLCLEEYMEQITISDREEQ